MQLGVHAGLSSRRSRVQIPSGPLARVSGTPENDYGRVAQLVERAPEKREVTGSMPVPTTTSSRRDPHCGAHLKAGPRELRLGRHPRPQAGSVTATL